MKLTKSERQNVRKAAQLLSHTTASAIQRIVSTDDCENVCVTADLIEKVAKWFSLMNTYTPSVSVNEAKTAYGQNLDVHNKILDDMLELMETMRCGCKTTLQTFQKGCIVSIKSLKALLQDLKEKYSVNYIMTHRLNQDVIENLFSQIRTRGGLNDHPTPLDALHRLRILILGKNQCNIKNNQCYGEEESYEYLAACVIKTAGLETSEQVQEEQQKIQIPHPKGKVS